ncbi:MAG: hypothetical protein QOH21_3372 [Acidobacteriota bacterium]|jgi:hypothetical protein|nr:hypothetical protein [Acidobacteriota bacterium]
MKQHVSAALALTALLLGACATAPAAKHPSAEALQLHDEIAGLDRAMFDAFNAHDAAKLGTYFDDSLEFYHDAGGLSGKAESVASLSRMFVQNNGIRRDLVPGSLHVYPIKDYGAIEVGAHRFCHQENGKDDCGVFQFVQIWQKKDGNWKITRVVSYDH